MVRDAHRGFWTNPSWWRALKTCWLRREPKEATISPYKASWILQQFWDLTLGMTCSAMLRCAGYIARDR